MAFGHNLLRGVKSAVARAKAKAACDAAEAAQKAGDAQRFREMAGLACVIMIRHAGIKPFLETRPHPGEFEEALSHFEGANSTALVRAGGLYAVALSQAGDYGQCIGFGRPSLASLRAFDDPASKIAQLELLAALGSSYREIGDAGNAAYCDRAWDEMEDEVRRLHPQPSWIIAFSTADALWTDGRREEAIATLTTELEAHGRRRGKDARDAADWVRLIAAMRETFVAIQTGSIADIVHAIAAEAAAAWKMGEASYDLAPEILLGRGKTLVDEGADPGAVRELAFLALVFARDVRNRQALRWRVLDALVPSSRSEAEAILLLKLAVEEVLSLNSDLSNIDDTLGDTEEGPLARLFSELVSRLIGNSRLAEASLVINLLWQKEIDPSYAAIRGGFSPNASLLVGAESAAAMIYYAARNAGEASSAESLMRDLGDYIESAVNSASDAVDGSTPSEFALASPLVAGEALLQVMPGASTTTLILRTATGAKWHSVPVAARQINAWVFEALQKIERGAGMDSLPELAHLFDQVVAPVLATAEDYKINRLIVATTGSLQSLPWSCLHDGKHWLIEKYSVCRASTEAQFWRDTPSGVPRMFIGGTGKGIDGLKGDIDVKPELDGLRAIADKAGSVVFAAEGDFTREALLDALQSCTIVSVSAHCFPDRLSPRQSRLMLGDGNTIFLDDLAPARTVCDLVVLSACETGRIGASLIPGGDVAIDRLLGTSGVKSIVSTAWAVNNASQTKLMLGFFDKLLRERIEKDVALAETQRQMIARTIVSNETGDDWSLPYFWAAPMLTGNWQAFA